MNNKKRAGMSGKGFYAALSLSVAMVGAACWYAYSEAGKLTPPAVPESSVSAEFSRPQTTSVSASASAPMQTTLTTAVPITRSTESVTEDAEEAAAILNHTTAETTAAPPAETAAPVEMPIAPTDGAVLQRFSHGELVKSPTTGIWQTHNGTDFDVPLGTEVLCTEDGTVIAVGQDALLGICVSVLHENGTVTRYCGLNEGLNVQAGDVIPRGTVIGAVGDTNEAESSLTEHLHFEVLRDDAYIDPESYLLGAFAAAPETETESAETE